MKKILKFGFLLFFIWLLSMPIYAHKTAEEQTQLALKIKEIEDKIATINTLQNEVTTLKVQLEKSNSNSKNAFEKIETERNNLKWWLAIIGISFAGVTIFSLWKLFNTTIPNLVKGEAKKRVDLHLTNEQNKFKDLRMAVVNKKGKEDEFHRELKAMGFLSEKLIPFSIGKLNEIDTKKLEYIFINDMDNLMTVQEIESITNHGKT